MKVHGYFEFGNEVDNTDKVDETKTSCNKDTREKVTLQKWTRGVLFSVSGGGHLQMWQPLKSNFNGDVHVYIRSMQIFRSEGPAQVFLIVLMWLITQFGSMSRDA